MAATPLFPLDVWTSQITQASIPANENSLRVEVLQAPAISRSNAPAGGETDGAMYVVGSSPSGAFSTFTTDNVVILKGGTWLEFEAFDGWVKTIGSDVNVFQEGTGWVVFAVGPTAEPWTYKTLASNFSNNTTTFNDITGWSFSGDGDSTYELEVFGAYQSAATTTGIGLKATGPTGSSFIGAGEIFTSATATAGFNQFSDSTPTTVSTGVTTANTNTPISWRALVKTSSTPGTIAVQMRSEVASSAVTLQAGLIRLRYRRLPL